MARTFWLDPLMACNFALVEVPASSFAPLAFPLKTARSAISSGNFIGFQSASVPEFSVQTREVLEGNWPYVHNVVVGYQSGGNITLTQAVLPDAIDMYLWWLQGVNGIGSPRRNMMLLHTRLDRSLPARILSCENCIPISWKPASDFDAYDSAVSIESMTMWTSRINVIVVPPTQLTAPPRPASTRGI